jgi:glycosyltransferase involved in cell wall biosynthesis
MTTNKLKICVYAISKNEEKFIKRFYESSKDADMILLADTGSTDNTVALAKECGMTVHEITVTPWRFDLARNVALCLIPKDYDVCVSLDVDEELQPGWREEIERVWKKGITNRLRYKFDWGVGIVFYYEKIHARHGFTWANMCHEVVATDPRVENNWAQTDMLLVVHKPDPTKSRGQYLDLLKADVTDNPYNARNAFYYARELSFNRKWREAIEECDRYLKLPGADWINERCYALRVKGRSYDELGESENALAAFRQACIEAPLTREPWVDLANSCFMKKMWNECFYAATQALSITHREWVYTVDPEVWGHKPYDLAALAAWNLGLKEKALEYGQLAVEKNPTDERLLANLEWYGGKIA